jgi:hypothetical protein
MDTFLHNSSRNLARDLDAISVQSKELTFSQLEVAMESAGQKFELEFNRAGRPGDVSLVYRAIANRVFDAAMETQQPVAVLNTYLQQLEKLGFADAQDEVTSRLKFARFLLDHSFQDDAKIQLRLVEQQALDTEPSLAWAAEVVDQLRERMV